jgi:UDP-N-acetylmuramoyl-tripeptide--D-alanyl-D-alanine ligase
MNSLTVFDLINATGGKLIYGRLESLVSGISTDTRSIKHGEIFFALQGENFDGHNFIEQAICNGAAGAVISDSKKIGDLSLNDSGKVILIEVSDTLRALGDIAKYYRQNLQAKFIAVTGSNGKTTTKDMLYHILKNFKNVSRSRNSFNNFIGVPLTIFGVDLTHDFCVVEMGTNAPGEIRRLTEIISPSFTILTNISHTHLAGLGSIEGVANAKAEFIENMNEDGTLITNADDAWCSQIASRFNGKVIYFGFGENAHIKASKVKRNKSGFIFTVNKSFTINLPVLGKHNIYNSLAAIALCNTIGIRMEDMCEIFMDFKLPPMRMEKRVCGDIIAINDGYNSNPSSMLAALDEFSQLSAPGRRIFVCGDMLELGKDTERLHKEIGKRVASSKVDILWTVGPFSRFVAEGAIANGMSSENVFSCDTSEETCSLIASHLKSKDTVLIKGSRRMKLECVSRQIENCFLEKKK